MCIFARTGTAYGYNTAMELGVTKEPLEGGVKTSTNASCVGLLNCVKEQFESL